MTDTTHDPPRNAPVQTTDLLPITTEQIALLSGRGFEKYALMRERLGREPLHVIRGMKLGHHQYKQVRGAPGILRKHRGQPIPDRMSFRQIADALTAMSGVEVTYETIRRWCDTALPGIGDEPEDDTDGTATPVANPARVRTAVRRTPRPAAKPAAPVAGDEHADAIRAAADRVNSMKPTNPAIPAAMFLPPAE